MYCYSSGWDASPSQDTQTKEGAEGYYYHTSPSQDTQHEVIGSTAAPPTPRWDGFSQDSPLSGILIHHIRLKIQSKRMQPAPQRRANKTRLVFVEIVLQVLLTTAQSKAVEKQTITALQSFPSVPTGKSQTASNNLNK